jgi:hypothetical protein
VSPATRRWYDVSIVASVTDLLRVSGRGKPTALDEVLLAVDGCLGASSVDHPAQMLGVSPATLTSQWSPTWARLQRERTQPPT